MHVSNSLSLPDALEKARADGSLVIFAGAGVSVSPPANLPSFLELAREIGRDHGRLSRRDQDSLDRYLGRLKKEHEVPVEEVAREILNRGGTRAHTPLHEHLLGVFGTADRVRLITTNFDTHFTTAAKVVYPDTGVRQYIGPALPQGRDFRGIVQLHGSLAEERDPLVLTDKTFASAYLGDGWAARFLFGVFAQYAVLFVGYGLHDPVLQYFMLAMPPSERRFALCHEDEQALFAHHEITPVVFKSATRGKKYGDLHAGMQRWAWYARLSASDHDAYVRDLVREGPPDSPIKRDYLRARLGTTAGRETFWDEAGTPAWLAWATEEGLLRGLVDPLARTPDLDRWATWVVTRFTAGEQPALLRFVQSQGLRPHPRFAETIAWRLTRPEPLPPAPVLRQFVALLANRPFAWPHTGQSYRWLAERLIREGLGTEALALLRHLTQLRLEPPERLIASLEKEFRQDDGLPRLTSRVGTEAPAPDLVDLLKAHGGALAGAAGDGLLALGEQRLYEAYDLLDLSRGAAEAIDWFSVGRVAIADSNQDEFEDLADVIVLLIRAVLDSWSAASPDRLRGFAMRHASTKAALLQRLRLHALSACTTVGADQLLEQAMDEGWPKRMELRPELYRMLRQRFGAAGAASKSAFIRALRDDAWWGADFDEHQRHARFSLSQHLVAVDPENEEVRSFDAAERQAHPDWRQQDPDGFLSRMEVSWGHESPSPISAEQILRWAAADALPTLHEELRQLETNRNDLGPLLGAIQQAVRADVAWGLALLTLASREADTRVDLVEAVCWGLHSSQETPSERLLLARIVAVWDWPPGVTRTLGMLLDRMSRGLGMEASVELLDAFDHAADLLYARAADSPDSQPSLPDRVDRAINHPAGNAASVWWNVANARDYVGGTFALSLDEPERRRWERVLGDDRPVASAARVILGMALDRLSNGDFPWAQRVVFPAFDPSVNANRAAELWDGRFGHSRWSWTSVQGLLPVVTAFFAHSALLVPTRAPSLGEWVAMLVAHQRETSMSLTLLEAFIRDAAVEARSAFSNGLPGQLRELPADARRAVWNDLLQPYWKGRLRRSPTAFDPSELAGLVQLVVALPDVWVEAFAMLDKTPGDAIPNGDRVLQYWSTDRTWLVAHADHAVAIIGWLAQRRSVHHAAYCSVELLEAAWRAGATPQAVIAAANGLAELAISGAAKLAQEVQQGGSGASGTTEPAPA